MKLKKIRLRINIFPKVKLYLLKKDITRVLDLLIKANLRYIDIKSYSKEEMEIEIYSSSLKKYNAVFNENDIDYKIGNEYGLISLFKKNKHRIGLIFGFVVLLLATFLSSRIIWKIDIVGNSKYSDEEILELLDDAGIRLGTFIPTIDYDSLHNKILLKTDKISWISVNIKGNVARIEVMETKVTAPKTEALYTNIVSKYDGQIASIMTLDGEEKIVVGDIVKAGDILISGVLDSQASGVRYVNAKGEVFAYVNKHIVVTVPRKDTILNTNENIHTDRSIKIFSNKINFSTKHSNCDEFCDRIEKKEAIKLFGKYKLPVLLTTTKHYNVEKSEVIYSNQEMVDIAFLKLKYEMDMAVSEAEIISKNVKSYFDGQNFIVECDIYCLENIAKEVEFFVE